MATKVATVTKRQTGVTISRNGGSFTVSWKFGDKDYDAGQTLRWNSNVHTKFTKVSGVGKSSKSGTFSISTNDIYPAKSNKKLKDVIIELSGTRKKYTEKKKVDKKEVTYNYVPAPSPYVYKEFSFYAPPTPSASLSLGSNYYTCNFNINSGSNASDHYWVQKICYQTVIVENSDNLDGTKVSGWSAVSEVGGTSYSRTFEESTSRLAKGPCTRWVKVWTKGAAGDSPKVYVRHIYAMPNAPKITKATATRSNSGYMCKVDWTIDIPNRKPVDQTEVQYVIATTGTTLSGWQNAIESAGTKSTGSATFPIDALVEEDKALYVRVNSKHDNNWAYGAAYRVTVGPLTEPSNLSVVRDDSTYRATITATNNSAVAGTFLAVKYMPASKPAGWDIGIIPAGSNSVTVQCPDWTNESAVKFGVRAVYDPSNKTKATPRADGVGNYSVSGDAFSAQITAGGAIPAAPTDVTADATDISGTVHVTWRWAWQAATMAEISWADHEDAWESTDEPSTYQVSNAHASAWNLSGLETGIVWHIRVRLGLSNGNETTWGPYSDTVSIDLSSAPVAPVIDLSAGAIAEDGDVTVSWTYSTVDGTAQASAQLALVTVSDNVATYTPIETVSTAQSITVNAADKGWQTGESYTLAVCVTSESGHTSEWSDPVVVYVVEPLTATISATSLVVEDITVDGNTRTVNSLKSMPFTLTVEGAGTAGTTTVAIERREDYQLDRPDESQLIGYEGETIVLASQVGEDEITIEREDLIGRLDDEALYRIVATVSDSFGQSATTSLDFEVHWTVQALMPEGTVEIDDEQLITKITPTAPTGAAEGDTVDIYRLSADRPVLIYSGAEFGTTYVDPYPTIGDYGGHRLVYRTADGDCITNDGHLAWLDLFEPVYTDDNIVDFGTGRVLIRYNIDVSNSWSKDFKETQYLGGSVQGDWNPAVSRSATVAASVVQTEDPDVIETMRRLAVYPGICHVRTKDGSSYAADVQVAEDYKQSTAHKIASFSLKITRVDTQGYDGMTLAEWEALHDEEE